MRTLNDVLIKVEMQQAMIDGTAVEWVVKDVESDHSPQLSKCEDLVATIVEVGRGFEEL